jgi:hypothetical protein
MPAASHPRTSTTAIRVPRIVGLPPRFPGLDGDDVLIGHKTTPGALRSALGSCEGQNSEEHGFGEEILAAIWAARAASPPDERCYFDILMMQSSFETG